MKEASRIAIDPYFLKIASVVAERSTCRRHQVGAVAVLDKHILSTGYNGAPAGLRDCLELGCLRDKRHIPSGTQQEICRAIHAEQNIIRLICKYSYTIDADGKTSETSGESLFTVMYSDTGEAKIRKQALGAEFTGKISDEEIYGETEYVISPSTIQQTIMINRYTGSFEETFNIIGAKGGLIHCGSCEMAKEKIF